MSLGTMIYVFMIIIVRREIRRFRHRSKWKSRSVKIIWLALGLCVPSLSSLVATACK